MTEEPHSFRMSASEATEPVLSLENISLGFDKGNVLDGLSLPVAPRETKVLIGESGSGKTLTLKMAAGLLQPLEGRISILGREIEAMSETDLLALRRQIGFVFQEGALFDSLTVR